MGTHTRFWPLEEAKKAARRLAIFSAVAAAEGGFAAVPIWCGRNNKIGPLTRYECQRSGKEVEEDYVIEATPMSHCVLEGQEQGLRGATKEADSRRQRVILALLLFK